MNWSQLLSLKRYGDVNPRPRKGQDSLRLGFEVDYDRVIFSQYFRSLQDKTQVVPMSQTGFVHTRLTHSLEVSVVARSLGRMVGKTVLQRHPKLVAGGYNFRDFGAISAAAALAHDIGNPPFGHSGEKAMGSYFSNGKGSLIMDTLSRKQKIDLHLFEGNANGYHLLNCDRPGTPGGLRLSYATLGAFVKYPRDSDLPHTTSRAYHKKYGIFQSDVKHFVEVAQQLGLTSQNNLDDCRRHPLAYLVEAADDICYHIIDFEDGINLGWIPEDYALEFFVPLVRDSIKKETYHLLATKKERIAYLRSLAIGTLIKDCTSVFLDFEPSILNGTFKETLLDHSRFKVQLNDILSTTIKKVYRNSEVLEKEIAGYSILNSILHKLLCANGLQNGEPAHLSKLVSQYCTDLPLPTGNDYEDIIATCSYVASLTDSTAAQLHKVLC